ncbi:Sodium/calcium exchanger protein-domain-containing protein [Mrakia frigida]|uniref:Sodium/calcium exchanger protein-domain-containing protein n=1 Tax=Mrakia frigida TaxID=29902 RepID=UPI003FCC1540
MDKSSSSPTNNNTNSSTNNANPGAGSLAGAADAPKGGDEKEGHSGYSPESQQQQTATSPYLDEKDEGRGRQHLTNKHLDKVVQPKQPRTQSTPEIHSPQKESSPSIHRGVRRAPTAPNGSSFPQGHGVVNGNTFASNFNGGSGTTTTPFNNGDENAASRPPLKDLLFSPRKKLASDAGLTWRVAMRNICTASWLNVMLVFLPVAWALEFSHQSDTLIFVFSFLSIVPLASLLGFATEQVALRVGDSLGGLLNATFGNAVELLISILALVKGDLDIVQSSMIGSILSNTLLVLGMCFFAGGLRFHEQGYGIRAAQLNISLLGIAVVAVVLPAAFHASFGLGAFAQPEGEELADLLSISRGIAFMLLGTYVGYLVFQLYTHAYLFKTVTPFQRRRMEAQAQDSGPSPPGSHVFPRPHWIPSIGGSSSSSSTSSRRSIEMDDEGHEIEVEEEEVLEVPLLTRLQAALLLVVVTVFTGVTAEFLIGSIDGMTSTGGVSREFVALILLPLVGNAAEHVTAVVVSIKDKIDLSLSIAVGSSIQIALFVIPVLVLLGWAIGQPLTLKFVLFSLDSSQRRTFTNRALSFSLRFDLFETCALFLTVLVVNWAIQDGKTNYLEGAILMGCYVIIALVTWYYPGQRALQAAALEAASLIRAATGTA